MKTFFFFYTNRQLFTKSISKRPLGQKLSTVPIRGQLLKSNQQC